VFTVSDQIKVTVCRYPDRANLVLRYVDPLTGRQKTKSAGTPNEAEAIKAAGKWEDELRTGRYQAPSRLTWAEFRRRCDAERLSAMPESSQVAYRVALDHLQRLIDPDRLAKLTPQVISRFQGEARKEGMKATTLARHLRHIKAALRWGERQGLLAKAPAVEMPKLPKGQSLAKHRPVTEEEFDRMVSAVPKVRPNDSPQWERLLRGLWLSGLRLGEAVALDWNDGPFVLDTTGKHPAFRIEAEGQKSRRSEVVPLTPDFAEWILAEHPKGERSGKVFPVVDSKTGKPYALHTVGPVVSAIGRKAGVVVGQTDKAIEEGGKLVRKPVKLFAGAHDLRRSFCSRWARKVMPAVLQRLARHAHYSTTEAYYVSLSADEIGADLWSKHGPTVEAGPEGNIFGNIGLEEAERKGHESCPKLL
jgi:integrase